MSKHGVPLELAGVRLTQGGPVTFVDILGQVVTPGDQVLIDVEGREEVAVVAFTLVVIMPTNRRLLDPALDTGSEEARRLLRRWGQLHAVRTVVGAGVFVAFVIMSAR